MLKTIRWKGPSFALITKDVIQMRIEGHGWIRNVLDRFTFEIGNNGKPPIKTEPEPKEQSPSRDNDFIVIDNHGLRTLNLSQLNFLPMFNPGSEPRASERPNALLSYRMDTSITSAPVIYYTKRLTSHYKKGKRKKKRWRRWDRFSFHIWYTPCVIVVAIQYSDVFSLNFSSFDLAQTQFPFIVYQFSSLSIVPCTDINITKTNFYHLLFHYPLNSVHIVTSVRINLNDRRSILTQEYHQ